MGSPANWITLLFVYACTLVVHGQNTATRIPESLIECYRNQSLRHPENRPPLNMQTFIDIVSKVEMFQRGTVDIAELATLLLHSFRLDGIERNPVVTEGVGVLPFAVTGFPFFKHRLILRYFVPSNNYEFPPEILSQVERCTLHFMLSHTTDAPHRGDEQTVCPRLSNFELGDRVRRHARFRRQTEDEQAAAANADEQKSEEGNTDLTKDAEQIPVGDTEKGVQGSEEDSENTSKHVSKDTDDSKEAPGKDHEPDTTEKQQTEVINQTANANGTKSGKYFFDDELGLHYFPNQKARSELDPEIPETDFDVQPRTSTESECPVEAGAVHTKWDTVSLGAVLAGLAAGLLPQQVSVGDLLQRTPSITNLPPELAVTTINNSFAATLAGDLAEAALQQGPRTRDNITIGLPGAWNSTIFPRWYFNGRRNNREMTDAEIRGGLDGLVMGTFIQEWRQQVSGTDLRLSQLLSMYYSEEGAFNPQNRACQRRDQYVLVAPNDRLQEQAFRFAVVLDHHSFTTASIASQQIRTFAEIAVRQLSSYIPVMNNTACARRQEGQRNVPLYTNVTVVIDTAWPFEAIRAILYQLALELELSEFGSRLTVLDGRNGVALITDAMLSIDVESNFSRSIYDNREGGLDIPRVLEQELRRSKEALLNAESEQNLAGGRSTVILFIPHRNIAFNNDDLTIARANFIHFRDFVPDVRFLYLVPGDGENFGELVHNPTTDIITYASLQTEDDTIRVINQVTDRIKEVPLRLFNPTCGANWSGADYITAEFIHSVSQQGVKFHRVHPNFLFGVGSAQVTVSGFNTQDLTVCFSRTNELPVNATSDEVTCQRVTQSANVDIRLENPCSGAEFISQCRPLFISVQAIPSTTPLQPASCTRECPIPTNVQYVIRHQGLGCRAGVGQLLSNPQLMFLTAALIFFMKYLKVGS